MRVRGGGSGNSDRYCCYRFDLADLIEVRVLLEGVLHHVDAVELEGGLVLVAVVAELAELLLDQAILDQHLGAVGKTAPHPSHTP